MQLAQSLFYSSVHFFPVTSSYINILAANTLMNSIGILDQYPVSILILQGMLSAHI